MRGSSETSFATLESSITVNGDRPHRLFSTRFSPRGSPSDNLANRLGVEQALELVRSIEPGVPVIFGGDFNANPSENDESAIEMRRFFNESGMSEVFGGRLLNRIDFLFFRGEYQATNMESANPEPAGSDHGFIFSVLQSRSDISWLAPLLLS
jgi:endonuclease/exonuclease/phosphatase (EEP) superfamily protein YafD